VKDAKHFMKITGLYIHIPFCIKKCNYCDFVSISRHSLCSEYIQALIKEIQLKSRTDFLVDTIYFGGGTPSILNAQEISCIYQSIQNNWKIQDHPEITIEVNPGTLSDDKIQLWKELGINRINLGVQSFHHHHLHQLGRIHHEEQAHEAMNMLKQAGFTNIGLDLMYGIPNQTLDEWKEDLSQAIAHHPQHLSCYSLTYEPGTLLYLQLQKKIIEPLPDTTVRQMMNTLFQVMAEYKYEHYETSNFAADSQFRSKHNQKYWKGMTYIGLGVASHSFVNQKRFWNCSDVFHYIKKLSVGEDPVENCEILTIEQQIIESIYLGLRQNDGINIHEFEATFPYRFNALFADVLKEMESAGYLDISKDTCRLSYHGKFYLDSICQGLVNAL